MSDKVTIEQTGFDTWMELWKWIKEQGLENEQKVTLTWDDVLLEEEEEKPADLTVPVILVKWKAFDELQERLPSKAAVHVIIDLIHTDEKVQEDLDTINNFLNNLPTKP
jgi:hypothetical protein